MLKICSIKFMFVLLFLFVSYTYSVKLKVLPEVCPEIVSRERWGARNPLEIDYTLVPVKNVIVHDTLIPNECNTENNCISFVKNTQNFYMNVLEFNDILYNFLVGGDGRIYEGVGWRKLGAHSNGWNKRSIGLAFIGHFSENLPNEKALQAAKNFLKCAVELKELTDDFRLIAGRQVSSIESPGLKLYREIKKWPHFTKNID